MKRLQGLVFDSKTVTDVDRNTQAAASTLLNWQLSLLQIRLIALIRFKTKYNMLCCDKDIFLFIIQ